MRLVKTLLPGFLGLAIVAFSSAAFATTPTTFDVPVPTAVPTATVTAVYPVAINSSGTVAGRFATTPPCTNCGPDSWGFVRDSAGNITTFGTPTGGIYNSLTSVTGINSSGTVVGYGYFVAGTIYSRGWIRAANGNITPINLSGAIGNTDAYGINDNGDVTGNYFSTSAPQTSHGFVLSGTTGRYKTFDVPNPSHTVTTTETDPISINLSGEVAGTFQDSTGEYHLFRRSAKGHITTYDIPNASGITVYKINDSGVIVGNYYDTVAGAQLGFTQTPAGKGKKSPAVLTTFTVPSTTVNIASDINSSGTVIGQYLYYDGTSYSWHGFLMDSSGKFTPWDIPNALDTYPTALNDSGVTTGSYIDSTNVMHGFVW